MQPLKWPSLATGKVSDVKTAEWPGQHHHHEVFTMTTCRFEMQFNCSGEDNMRVQVFWDVKLSSRERFLMF